MAIGSNDSYRMSVEPDFNFAMDQMRLVIVKKGHDGVDKISRAIRLEIEVLDPIEPHTSIDNIPYSVIPNELAELMMQCFARYFLSSEGDLVATIRRVERERDYFKRQLEQLIAGIGRMGGNDSQH